MSEHIVVVFLEAPPDSNTTGRCPHCRLALGSEECLNAQLKVDGDLLKCQICGLEKKGKRQRGEMRRHLRSHTGEKGFFCLYYPHRGFTLRDVGRHVDDIHLGKYLFSAVSKSLMHCV